MAEQARIYLQKNPLELYADGLYCLREAKNVIDILRSAGIISVATVKLISGPVVITHRLLGRIRVNHHALVEVHQPEHFFIDPTAEPESAVTSNQPNLQD